MAAAMAGDPERAYDYYVQAASTDLRTQWPTDDGGLHAAACAALPLALMVGFAGMWREDDGLSFRPRLPAAWSRIGFTVVYRGEPRRVEFTRDHS
jgi:trehalose/maltose hydrolase-like predicted phosphorylase